MTIKTIQVNPSDGKSIHFCDAYGGGEPLTINATYAQVHGLFKSVTRITEGTSMLAQPDAGGSLILTDLLISTSKFALSSMSIVFTDGINTVNIFTGDSNNAPVSVFIPFAGRWQGWAGARLELITVGMVIATAAVGYLKVPHQQSLKFPEWNALR